MLERGSMRRIGIASIVAVVLMAGAAGAEVRARLAEDVPDLSGCDEFVASESNTGPRSCSPRTGP